MLNEEVTNPLQGEVRVVSIEKEPADLGAVGLSYAPQKGCRCPVIREFLPCLEVLCPDKVPLGALAIVVFQIGPFFPEEVYRISFLLVSKERFLQLEEGWRFTAVKFVFPDPGGLIFEAGNRQA